MIERLRQTYRHLASEPDGSSAASIPAELRALVEALPRADRRHALATYAKLSGREEEVRIAGLLHDTGKPPGARLWHRVAVVLAPGVARRIGGRVMREYLDHAGRGAERARALGLSNRVVLLIAEHHAPPSSPDARALAQADRE